MGMGMPPMGGGGAPGMGPGMGPAVGAMPNGRVPWLMQYGAGMQYGVAMQQQAAIQAYFYQIDTDRNGTLDNGELGRALAAGGMPLTPEVVGTLMQVFDLDRNGTIGMFEWVPLFQFTQKITSRGDRCGFHPTKTGLSERACWRIPRTRRLNHCWYAMLGHRPTLRRRTCEDCLIIPLRGSLLTLSRRAGHPTSFALSMGGRGSLR